jgi:hypothetical protein
VLIINEISSLLRPRLAKFVQLIWICLVRKIENGDKRNKVSLGRLCNLRKFPSCKQRLAVSQVKNRYCRAEYSFLSSHHWRIIFIDDRIRQQNLSTTLMDLFKCRFGNLHKSHLPEYLRTFWQCPVDFTAIIYCNLFLNWPEMHFCVLRLNYDNRMSF